MHRFFLLLFLGLLIGNASHGQYFQQEVSYQLNVTLEDDLRLVRAEGHIKYTNNAPDYLDTIYFHIWPDAFKNEHSAFARQQLKMQSTNFYFAHDSLRGGYDKLNVGASVGIWHADRENQDMGYLHLNTTLPPGATIAIPVDFELKLPYQFSRLGVNGHYIQLTHWYPKPAVYDQSGWHWFPYLAMGEFYSEFGTYDISIAIPEYLDIASTGIITRSNIENDYTKYSIQAFDVIDMAIVMHPHYKMDEKQFHNPDGSTVDLRLFYGSEDKVWADSAMYFLESAMDFYTNMIGPYPYPQFTLVQQKGGGGGMEYPMLITVSASDYKTLDYYINHEVGHQWFYGILAFNEREEPYLDEGLTTFFEHLYTIGKRGKDYHTSNFPRSMTKDLNTPILQQGYLWQKRRSFSESGSKDPQQTSVINYGLNAYEKAAYIYQYLYEYLGENTFMDAIRSFYDQWKFRHPGLEDLVAEFEVISQKDCKWIIPLLREDPVLDFKISTSQGTITVINNGEVSVPFQVTYDDGSIAWFPLLDPGSSTVVGANAIAVNDGFPGLELREDDNHIESGSLSIVPFMGIDNARKKEMYFIPLVTWNYADGLGLGTVLYNSSFPSRRFQYAIAPQTGLSSGDLIGNGWIAYNIYPKDGAFRKIQFKLSTKRYNYFFNEPNDLRLNYTRLTPQVSLHLRSQPNSQRYSKLTLRSILLNKQLAEFTSASEFNINTKTGLINQFKYEFFDFNVLDRKEIYLIAEQQSYTNVFEEPEDYIKLMGKFKYQYQYSEHKHIFFQVYAAGFLRNTQRGSSSYDPDISAGAIALLHQGFNDYTFEEYFMNRQQGDAAFTNQVSSTMGGFKDALGPQYTIGQSNDFAASIHLSANLPMNLPFFFKLRPYIDFGYYRSKSTINAELQGNTIYSGGFMLSYLDGSLEIYFPLFSSKVIRNVYSELGENIFQRISFSIDLHRINPWDLIDDLNF